MTTTLTIETARAHTSPIARALETLDRSGVQVQAGAYLQITDTAVTVYSAHPDEGGEITSGPYTLGSGAGLSCPEVVGYARARISAASQEGITRWSAALGDGVWLVTGRSEEAEIGAWTVAAGFAPGSVSRVGP